MPVPTCPGLAGRGQAHLASRSPEGTVQRHWVSEGPPWQGDPFAGGGGGVTFERLDVPSPFLSPRGVQGDPMNERSKGWHRGVPGGLLACGCPSLLVTLSRVLGTS